MNSQPIKVIIADDHELFRDGLKMLLTKNKDIEIIAEASDGTELIELVNQHPPDVILVDLIMKKMGGIEAAKIINETFPDTKIVAISTYDSEQLIIEALEAGAVGYVSKNAKRNEIINAIKTVYNHHPYYCGSTSIRLAKLISKSQFNPYMKHKRITFSEREITIIRLLCEEKTNEEISKILFMGRRNVEYIRGKIMEKMHVKTLAGVAIYAIKNGIISID